MSGKKYREACKKIDSQKNYPLSEAVSLLQDIKVAKFDESVDLALRLGIDARQTDQMVRGAVSLPNGTGKDVKILAFAKGDKITEAEEAGADFVGGEDLIEKIQGGWMEFDKVVAAPDMMAIVSKVGKLLGPRGLMPNPKVGTVTFELKKVIEELKAGRVEFRNDKAGIVHAAVAKLSFSSEKVEENIKAFVAAVLRAKPASSKGHYLKAVFLSSTMGPGLSLETSAFA